jgi:hypothetical protein
MTQALAFPDLIGTKSMMSRLTQLLPKGYGATRLAQIALTLFRNSPNL